MDAYELNESRFVQCRQYNSSVNGHSVSSPSVPEGKIWTILAAELHPDADETQRVWFTVLDASLSRYIPITIPASQVFDVSELEFYPLLREGMEIKLFPGERLLGYRQAHTKINKLLKDNNNTQIDWMLDTPF